MHVDYHELFHMFLCNTGCVENTRDNSRLMQTLHSFKFYSHYAGWCCMRAVVAEWLRRWTRNLLGVPTLARTLSQITRSVSNSSVTQFNVTSICCVHRVTPTQFMNELKSTEY